MTDFKIEYVDTLPDNLDERVRQGHIADEAAHGIVCNYKTFSFTAKNNSNEVVGVLAAYTAFSEIYVDDIWVDPVYRKAGLGRKLLQTLENQFKGKGYNNINLVTSQFQTPDFYKKCGFEIEFVRQNKFNPQLTKFFFIKYFDDEIQNQGIKIC
ncbi:MAG TPA: GNAT family N-acetyltransferase [Gammaproteobacteria bacterium]|jgi:ribosomal protein S18 acetylase RimI-like enzyme|nr:GNAT family N-acetyltransferase [Gammaproteobacteria bacterium]